MKLYSNWKKAKSKTTASIMALLKRSTRRREEGAIGVDHVLVPTLSQDPAHHELITTTASQVADTSIIAETATGPTTAKTNTGVMQIAEQEVTTTKAVGASVKRRASTRMEPSMTRMRRTPKGPRRLVKKEKMVKFEQEINLTYRKL